MSQTGQQDPPEKASGSARRKISAKAFVTDVRGGVDDAGLMEKHDLTVSGLWKIFDKLVIAGLLDSAELQARRTQTATVNLPWKCPFCKTPQAREFERCPECGIIVAKVTAAWKCPACRKPQTREFEECPECGVIVSKFLARSSTSNRRVSG